MSFLNAHWENLILINYSVDPKILKLYLPVGTVLDFFEEKCYVSIVGFMFKNTKLLGLEIPFHKTFEEVNLRFYVKRFENNEWKRGVVFIKEIVPKPALSFVANSVYKEHYITRPMKNTFRNLSNNTLLINYQWKSKNKWNSIEVTASKTKINTTKGSLNEFITEHYWGYTKLNNQKTSEYEVIHPKWKSLPVTSHTIDIDFKETYGSNFEFLEYANPDSVILADGSEISVENKRILRD